MKEGGREEKEDAQELGKGKERNCVAVEDSKENNEKGEKRREEGEIEGR